MPESSAQTHPSPEMLRRFGSGELSGPEAADIGAHVATCAECRLVLQARPGDPPLHQVQTVSWAGGPGVSPATPSEQQTLPDPNASLSYPGKRVPQAPVCRGMRSSRSLAGAAWGSCTRRSICT